MIGLVVVMLKDIESTSVEIFRGIRERSRKLASKHRKVVVCSESVVAVALRRQS